MWQSRFKLLSPATWPVKTKLVLTASIPLLLLVPVVAMLLYAAGESVYSKVLISKVRSDLVIASQVFERFQQSKLDQIRTWAGSARLRNLMRESDGQILAEQLQSQSEEMDLSYLRFINLSGKVESSYPAQSSQGQLSFSELEIIRGRQNQAQVILVQPEELAAISTPLRQSAQQPILATNNASPDGRTLESRGMLVQVITPVFFEGQQKGWLEGGVLLNRNFDLVDNLRDLIYPSMALLDGSEGSATLFLEDVRVSTTIELNSNQRALGTRVSDVVRQSVMGRGEIWLERAFVVNNWYWAGYAPITSPTGSRIGMLYVGFLEAPYAALKTQLLVLFLLAVAGAMILGALFVNQLARVIFKPLGKMNAVMARQAAGDTLARVGGMRRQDEFSELSHHFDNLLDQLQARRQELESINAELDARVSQRTAALHEANEKLREAINQVLATEKLALMGQLTAGVAHEFNNPLAIMMGHLDLLRMELQTGDASETVVLLDGQVQRMQSIVQKLLQFCRPEDRSQLPEVLDIEQVITDSLLFAKAELAHCAAQIERRDGATRAVEISQTELQQIMVNLLINASHALSSMATSSFEGWSPKLSIVSENCQLEQGHDAVRIRVENNGPMIPKAQQEQIFKMFFTTKREGKGSGVGLSVSKMLVQRGGGNLNLFSPTQTFPHEHGVVFEVILRCQASPTSSIID